MSETTLSETSIDNIIEPVQQQARLLSDCRFDNHAVDKWERAKFIVPVILKIRAQCPNDQADEATFSKLHRLLLSELPPLIDTTIVSNIDIFTRMLCNKSSEDIKNIDIGSLRTFLTAPNATVLAETFFSPCPICYEMFPINRIESFFLCDHTCCSNCMRDYYRTAINTVQDVSAIGALTCYRETHPIDSEDLHHLFFTWLQIKIRQWFPDDIQLQDRYIDRVTIVISCKQIKNCGNPKCTSSFFAEDNPAPARVRCNDCQFSQCSQCGRKWTDEHKKRSCDEYADWLYDNDPEDDEVIILRSLLKNAIVCPTCKTYYACQGGAEHFSCPSCKTDFCRMCSSLYYFPNKEPKCTIETCVEKNSMHAHCPPNCFREIRDAGYDAFYQILQENGIDAISELRKKFPATERKCTMEDCNRDSIVESENRLCLPCSQEFLWKFIWDRGIEPWELYEDHQLVKMLQKVSVAVPANSNRPALIQLCQKNLNANLGKPRKIEHPRNYRS